LIEKCENDDVEREKMLICAINHGRAEFVKRLVENTSVHVNFYKNACRHGHFEIFQLLCAKFGEPWCSDIISPALRGGNVDILAYIKSRGVDMSDFGLFVYACTDFSNASILEYLVSEGADVKHPLIAYIAKRHAREEVRELLLAHIDDESESPYCYDLEKEINGISFTFWKRITAGYLDRVYI
jgi:hypothetical protein